MNPALSLYLDLLRFLAALAVFFFHAGYFSGHRIDWLSHWGSHAVLVFFVLSGLVISHVSAARRDGLAEFMIARLARLWSVMLPALLLTLLLDLAGQAIHLASYAPMQPYSSGKWFAALIANALFLNQLWSLSFWPGTNGPFWSMAYEFWYYILFAAGFFLTGYRRLAVLGLLILAAGPKIIVAWPIWLCGVALHHALRWAAAGPRWLGGALWLGSFAIAALGMALAVPARLVRLFPASYAWSEASAWSVDFWPLSYAIGLLVALNVFGFAMLSSGLPVKAAVLAPLRRLADTSFGLYLLHYPLMYFTRALLQFFGCGEGGVYVAVLYSAPLIVAIAIAFALAPLKLVLATRLRRLKTTMAT